MILGRQENLQRVLCDECLRAGGRGGHKDLEHVPVFEFQLRNDDRRLMEARCHHRGAKRGARYCGRHVVLFLVERGTMETVVTGPSAIHFWSV